MSPHPATGSLPPGSALHGSGGKFTPSGGSLLSRSPEETLAHAREAAALFPRVLVLLHGDLGAGKTLWTTGFAEGLGLTQPVSSPSFTILNIYREAEKVLYHLDLYRIDHLEEVIDAGLFEIIEGGHPCVVEWAERVPELAGLPHLAVSLRDAPGEESRQIDWAWKPGRSKTG